ncbi:MAG: hypothetical protein QOK36_3463 [Gaiellales bacterium]|nr:hypothetical protein [Gaiellales bacterium]
MKRRSVIALACAVLVVGVAAVTIGLARGGSPASIAPPAVPPARPVVSLARGALALARQDGNRVVALSLEREGRAARARVTVLGPSGNGVGGLAVTLDPGVHATPCGRGCYRALLRHPRTSVVVRVGRPGGRVSRTTFPLPHAWPVAASAALKRVERTLRSSPSIVYREHLASAPGHAITSLWRIIAPNRLAYTVDNGSAGVVIGSRRWDRDAAGGPWLRSSQEPLHLPALPWGARVQNVFLLDPPVGRQGQLIRFALFDPATPAWYEATVDARSDRIRSVRMTGASHFMRDDYLAYDSAAPIRPPRAAAK